MRRLTGILAFGMAVAAVAAGCAPSDSARRFLSLGSAPPGGAFFVVGSALSEVISEHLDERSMTSEATSGSQENIRRLTSGELDFALSNASITYFAVRGTEGWDRAYPVRSVMTLAQNVALFVAPAGAGVQRIADFRGRRVVLGPAGAGLEFFMRPLLAAHGISYDDFTPLNATQAAAVDMLADGSAAAAFMGGAVPTASAAQATASQDVVFVSFEADATERLVADYPFFHPAIIPAGTYRGQDEDFESLDIGSLHLITSAGQDEDLVYQITRILYEQREQVTARHAAGRAITADNVVRDTGTEFHPGAIRYYREIGIWPQ